MAQVYQSPIAISPEAERPRLQTLPPDFSTKGVIQDIGSASGHFVALAANERRWFRLENPYGRVPDGHPGVYGPASAATWTIETNAYTGGMIDTVIDVHVMRRNGVMETLYGANADDRAWDNLYSRIDVTLNPYDVAFISLRHYYAQATDKFYFSAIPTMHLAPMSSWVSDAPRLFSGSWYGDVAAEDTRHLVFRVPSSGAWQFRTERGEDNRDYDTVLTVYTVVGSGPMQLLTGMNDDIAWPINAWSSVQGEWTAGTYVIVQVRGWGGRAVPSLRVRAVPIASGG